MKSITYEQLKRFIHESIGPRLNVVERIKIALQTIPDVAFSKVIEQRAKTIINVNSKNPLKARALMSRPQFAQACKAQVIPLRKTIRTRFSLCVQDQRYGKPVIIFIRTGGDLGRGMKNEVGIASIIENKIQSGISSIIFKDDKGGKIVINNPVSIRRVGSDPGSRMGNRADIEIMDEAGIAHRISVKKGNFNAIAKTKRFFATRQFRIQKSLRAFVAANNIEIPPKGYISVPVRNPSLFKFCWFGKDIDQNGGVIEGDFENNSFMTVDEASNSAVIKCIRVFSPNDNINKLMTDESTCAWLIMKIVNNQWRMEIIGVYNNSMAKKHFLPGFEIDGVTNDQVVREWNKFIESCLFED